MLAEKASFPVAFMCRHLEVSRAGFYAWLGRPESERSKRNRDLTQRIKKIHKDSRGTYGSPRVHVELVGQGKRVGRHTVAKLMRQAGVRPAQIFPAKRAAQATPRRARKKAAVAAAF
jgi:transposase InsO family protein